MINKKLAFMAIPVLAAILIGGSLAPAFAAQKTIDINDVTVSVFPFAPFCTANPTTVVIRDHFIFKEWDNGHFKFHIDTQIQVFDAVTGALVYEENDTINDQGGPSGLPFNSQFNFEGACADGSGAISFHLGFTIDENGNFHNHGP